MWTRVCALLVCALPILAFSGCGEAGPPEPELAPVSGVVTLDGKPLPEATVIFGGVSRGITDAEGRYELSRGEKKGAPMGKQRVVIDKWVLPDGSLYTGDVSPLEADAKQLLPSKYSDEGASELTADVPAGGGTIDFDLKSR